MISHPRLLVLAMMVQGAGEVYRVYLLVWAFARTSLNHRSSLSSQFARVSREFARSASLLFLPLVTPYSSTMYYYVLSSSLILDLLSIGIWGSLDHKFGGFRVNFPPMHRRLGAPFGSQAADGAVGVFVEVQQVTDDAAVEPGAVWVGIG